MSYYIGYSIFDTTTNKIIPDSGDYRCGRNDLNLAWGNLFVYAGEDADGYNQIAPTFNKEMDGRIIDSVKYKYMKLSDFCASVEEEVADARRALADFSRRCDEYEIRARTRIAELRELQLKCTSEQSYAFDKWEQAINDLYSDLYENRESSDEYIKDEKDDIKSMTGLLNGLRTAVAHGQIALPFAG